MHLEPEEPAALGWRHLDEAGLRQELERLLPASGTRLVLVDGRSGAGKTTVAERVAAVLEAALVHTDDVAWGHSFFGWDDLLLDHILGPWRRGEPVEYTPPGWAGSGRSGTLRVPASRTLVVEGVGACRANLGEAADLCVWVQSDRDAARERGLARDVVIHGRTPEDAEWFWNRWMSEEDPFQATSRPWTRALLVVRGTTHEPLDPDHVAVAEGPLG